MITISLRLERLLPMVFVKTWVFMGRNTLGVFLYVCPICCGDVFLDYFGFHAVFCFTLRKMLRLADRSFTLATSLDLSSLGVDCNTFTPESSWEFRSSSGAEPF